MNSKHESIAFKRFEWLSSIMSDVDSLDSMTVNQLKEELGSRGLPKSGKKAELVERLHPYFTSKEDVILTSAWKRTVVGPLNLAQVTGSLFVVTLLLVVVFNPSLIGLGEDEPVYEPIDFDASQARWYAEELEGRFYNRCKNHFF